MAVVNSINQVIVLGLSILLATPSVALCYSGVENSNVELEHPLFMCDLVAVGNFIRPPSDSEQNDGIRRDVKFTVAEYLSGTAIGNPVSIFFSGTVSISDEKSVERNAGETSDGSERSRNPHVPKELYELLDATENDLNRYGIKKEKKET